MTLGNLQITDAHIDTLERRWSSKLARTYQFDAERRAILKHLASCDVQACPGGGKTTTLTAKLELLLEQWPDGHQGICVLSHTNAARTEIEGKLDRAGERLLRRPHLVGTIQHFVNHFLATPEAIERYGVRPWTFDDAAHHAMMARQFMQLDPRRRHYYRMQSGVDDGVSHLANLSLSFNDPAEIVFWTRDVERIFPNDSNTSTNQELRSIKNSVAAAGCFSFHDAYSLGRAYLARHPEIRAVLARRFPSVFIDEMQDTDAFQVALLQDVFAGRSAVQCFGDVNQNIFGNAGAAAQSQEVWPGAAALTISSTHRLSPSIATLSERLGVRPHTLQSTSGVAPYPHTVFAFDDPAAVLPAFAELIAGTDLPGDRIYAVAGVARPSEQDRRYSLTSYFPEYAPPSRSTHHRQGFHAFWMEAQALFDEYGFAGPAHDMLMACLLQFSRELNLRRPGDALERFHSLSSLRQWLRPRERELRALLLRWLRLLAVQDLLDAAEVISDVVALLCPDGNSPAGTLRAKRFAALTAIPNNTEAPGEKNEFSADIAGRTIVVGLGTVHSVKGQTHRATLLLESFMNKSDLTALLPALCGHARAKKPGVNEMKRLNVAYVAMTRPTHLLCLAIQRPSVTEEYQEALSRAGWVVRFV